MKKRVLAIAFVVVILSVSLVACGKNTDVPKGMKLASDKSNGFYTMYVPEDWVLIQTGSNVTFAQAQEKVLRTNELAAVTVNAMFWKMDSETAKKTQDEQYASFFENYKQQMADTFKDGFYPAPDPEASSYYEGAKEYSYITRYDDVYYKYIATIIVHNQIYYAITFNFPQSNLKVDKDGNITPTESYELAEFDYVEQYSSSVKDVVSNFKPLK